MNTTAPTMTDELQLVTGTMRDYHVLAEHHYRAQAPAIATRVLVLRWPYATAADRFAGRQGCSQVVGVLVESLPSLACRMRDWALRDRFGSWMPPKSRAMLLNHELRCISRVVIDPRWRGMGLAVRLVHAALDEPTTRYTEAIAAMGRVHPFFEKAGMTAYPRPPHPFDTRLRDALVSVGITPANPALPGRALDTIHKLPGAKRDWLLRELRRWHAHHAGRSGARVDDPVELLKAAQQRLMFEPVYYLKVNVGCGI